MISPVSLGAAPSAVPTNAQSDELLRRALILSRGPRAAASAGESRVDISAAGAAQSSADAGAPTPADPAAPQTVPLVHPGLAYAKADINEDGVVTRPEEHAFEARHLERTAPADVRPHGADSEPIRTYRSVEATLAGR